MNAPRRLATEELQLRLSSIVQTESDAIITSDESGRIRSWNPGAQRLFGYEEAEVLDRDLTILIPQRYRDSHIAGMRRLSADGAPRVLGRAIEVHAIKKGGGEFPVELTLGMSIHEGRHYFSAIIRDITRRRAAEETIAKQNRMLSDEMERNNRLLENILPLDAIEELKASGKYAPRYLPETTVLFADLHCFTGIAESSTPQELVDRLHELFSAFDEAARTHGLEKIKTIGDAYMCAGGLRGEPNAAVAVGRCAVDMQRIMRRRFSQWKLRIGIHCGPVVAGIVGQWKYTYDVWGDTVNIASRMESAGLAGGINVSSAAWEKMRHRFAFRDRGERPVRGKTTKMRMYLMTGVRKRGSE